MAQSRMKVALGVAGVLALGFVGYVQSRPAEFRYERSGVIGAAPAVVFPYLTDFHLGNEWSPYSRKDPNATFTFSGPESGVGAKMAFAGNKDMGAGHLEILQSDPEKSVELRLTMKEPFAGENDLRYALTPEGSGTRFTWTMTGKGGFVSKLMTVLIDCDKMIGKDFEAGIQNLKTVIEAKSR